MTDANRSNKDGNARCKAVQNTKEIVADVNITDKEGDLETALFYAVQQSNNESVVRAWIDAGADVNITYNKGKTALFYAVQQSNNESVVRALIDAGADVNITDNEGNTALFYAVQQSNNESVVPRALIDAGADVNITDNEGNTALLYAVQYDIETHVHALIDAGADVNVADNEGKTALLYAVRNDSFDIAKALVEGNADVNYQDIYGRTPLFYAMTISQKLFKYLLGKNGDMSIRDYRSVSILSYFIEICTLNQTRTLQTEMENIMKKKMGIKKIEAFETIINFVFCKFLHITFGTDSKRICELLKISQQYIGTEQHHEKIVAVNEIISLLGKEDHRGNLCVCQVPAVLELLLKLGPNPNSVDIEGNSALHYATRLPFWGVSENILNYVFNKLEGISNLIILKNHNDETPLLFGLSQDTWKMASQNNHWSQLSVFLKVVCEFLLKRRFNLTLTDVTKERQESVIHLTLKLFIYLSESSNGMKKELTDLALELLKMIITVSKHFDRKAALNMKDYLQNSPLHYWAQLQPSLARDSGLADFKDLSREIFHIFLRNKASLNQRNNEEQTPLHVAKSWHAVELLLANNANTYDQDSCGRSPLIVAAGNATNLRQGCCHFYPDVSRNEMKSFWDTALSKGLDLWTVDKNGESILSILIGYNDFALANSLLEFAKEKGHIRYNEVATNLLNAICKDKSTPATQKIDLVNCILECRASSPLVVDSHLLVCCTIISESLPNVEGNDDTEYSTPRKKAKRALDVTLKNTVHWKIAERLLEYGADGRSEDCLKIVKTCPALKPLLTSVDIETIPLAIKNWKPVSLKHRKKLEKIARRQECLTIGSFWYHREPLNKAMGRFGTHVFAGVNSKDVREVAVKRAELEKPEHKHLMEEMRRLASLTDCKQVITYFRYHKDRKYFYVVLELMEGNLEEYLNKEPFNINLIIKLCKDLLLGLIYMHSKEILHGSINPNNILFKGANGNVCFKFANFTCSSNNTFWIAPERLPHATSKQSTKSEIFSFGRVLLYCLYILSKKSHDADRTHNLHITLNVETINDNFNTWEKPPCPEATNLVKQMLEKDPNIRTIAEDALGHPWLWSQKKKRDFLSAVGNQPEADLKAALNTNCKLKDIIKCNCNKWDDLVYIQVFLIKRNMTRTNYDTTSVADLLRFIRNVIIHNRDLRKKWMRDWVLEENGFQKSYPKLIMEVLQVIKGPNFKWHLRREISDVLSQE